MNDLCSFLSMGACLFSINGLLGLRSFGSLATISRTRLAMARRNHRWSFPSIGSPAARPLAFPGVATLPDMSDNAISVADILAEKHEDIVEILRVHRGKELHLFGSAARGEDTPDSDIDFLVVLEDDASLFDHIDMRIALEAALGRHVDLVDRDALTADFASVRCRHLRERIFKDARLVCDRR